MLLLLSFRSVNRLGSGQGVWLPHSLQQPVSQASAATPGLTTRHTECGGVHPSAYASRRCAVLHAREIRALHLQTVAALALSSSAVMECVGVSALYRTTGTCSGPLG